MTPEALVEELAAGTLQPAYLVVGAEPLLRDDAVAAIRAAVLPDGTEDFNFDRLDAAATSPAALLDALGMLPVMSPRRLVLLRGLERARGGALVDAIEEAVAAAKGSETVLVVVAEKADARARWVKAFGKARIDCSAPRRARDVAAFVRAEAERQGIALERAAAELLAELVGPQLLMLRQEIAKAALLAGPGEKVKRAHVAEGAVDVAEEPIWDLTDAIGEGRAADALGVLAKLMGGGAPPPVVLGALASHFRRLLRVRAGANVPGPPFVLRKLTAQAKRSSPRRLRAALGAIHQTDLALKGEGNLRPRLALERLVIGLSA